MNIISNGKEKSCLHHLYSEVTSGRGVIATVFGKLRVWKSDPKQARFSGSDGFNGLGEREFTAFKLPFSVGFPP